MWQDTSVSWMQGSAWTGGTTRLPLLAIDSGIRSETQEVLGSNTTSLFTHPYQFCWSFQHPWPHPKCNISLVYECFDQWQDSSTSFFGQTALQSFCSCVFEGWNWCFWSQLAIEMIGLPNTTWFWIEIDWKTVEELQYLLENSTRLYSEWNNTWFGIDINLKTEPTSRNWFKFLMA